MIQGRACRAHHMLEGHHLRDAGREPGWQSRHRLRQGCLAWELPRQLLPMQRDCVHVRLGPMGVLALIDSCSTPARPGRSRKRAWCPWELRHSSWEWLLPLQGPLWSGAVHPSLLLLLLLLVLSLVMVTSLPRIQHQRQTQCSWLNTPSM